MEQLKINSFSYQRLQQKQSRFDEIQLDSETDTADGDEEARISETLCSLV